MAPTQPPPPPTAPPATFKVGSITRVKLHNFLTYSDVEFCPGPRLNVVMGPNGTGKSSIVCAIAIGLGASPKVLGRADTVSDFVMNGTDEASTEIELLANAATGKKLVIRREMARTSRGKSKWKIDGRSATEPDVKKVVEELNVQIGNLCTFLPQEKVGEFSAFDDLNLLKETERALGGEALVLQHEALVAHQKEMNQHDRRNEGQKERLEELELNRTQLAPQKRLLEKRQEHVEKIALCEKRRMWMRFEALKDEAKVAKREMLDAEAEKREAEVAVEPAMEKEREGKADVVRLDRAFKGKLRAASEQTKAAAESLNAANQTGEALEGLRSEANNLEVREQTLLKKHKLASDKAASARGKFEALEKKTDVAAIQAGLKESRPELDAARQRVAEADRKHSDSVAAMRPPSKALEASKKELKSLENMAARKIHALSGLGNEGRQCAKLRQWIDENSGTFRMPILGPVALCVRGKTQRDTEVCESIVGKWLWYSFVCQSKTDYDELNKMCSSSREYNLVNLQCCENVDKQHKRPYDEQKMRQLKDVGHVNGYIDDCIEAPPAIMEVLRSMAKIHTTLVGSERTEAALASDSSGPELEKLLSSAGSYLLVTAKPEGNNNFSLTRTQGISSRYGQRGDLTVSSSATQKKGIIERLVHQADPSEVDRVRRDVEAHEESCSRSTAATQEAKVALAQCNAEAAELEASRKDDQKRMLDLKKAKDELDRLESLQAKLEKETTNAEENMKKDRARVGKQMASTLKKLVAALLEAATQDAESQRSTVDSAGPFVHQALAKSRHATAQRELQERERDLNDVRRKIEVAKRAFDYKKQIALDAKREAERDAPLDDELKERLMELPDGVDELEALIEAEKAEVERIHEDKEILGKFAKLEAEILKLEATLAAMEDDQAKAEARLAELRDPWERKLRAALEQLKSKFEHYMSSLRARGSVAIVERETFDKWGLSIQVAFRDDSELQQLQAHVQSGGERSVSTIMFLMALQAHMPSPFRVVDEINQGMDESNERIVFNRIVQNSTGPDAPQYFLITPKLLQGLTDMNHPDIRALIVFNGPWNVKRPADWNIPAFINKKQRLCAAA